MRLATMSLIVVAIIALLSGGVYLIDRAGQADEIRASLSVADALRANRAGFNKVTEPREFSFPLDHGPHPDYALEWWYFTGHLDTPENRHFGYELTFFRIGINSEDVQRRSDWASGQIYAAHFALTDVEGEEFHSFERFSRNALGLAGATATPFRVWLEDWSVESTGDGTLPVRMRANEGEIGIDLLLDQGKAIVLHGEDGFSRKGNAPGEASYYYSMTRLPTEGTLMLDGRTYKASGMSWFDREWSSTQLSEEHIGWDWFALQLSNGRDIMYGVLRPNNENGSRFELGTVVEADGEYRSITVGEVQVEVLDRWQSPSGDTYPSRWLFTMPSEGLRLDIIPYISNQELDTIVRYWEGAVRIEGTANGSPIRGNGYVELTGYAD